MRRIFAVAVVAASVARAEAVPPTLQDLADQNQALKAQVEAQQKRIEQLEARLEALERPNAAPAKPAATPASAEVEPTRPETSALSAAAGEAAALRVSGEAGFAYFQTGRDGTYPKGEFRVDEARIYLDAPVSGSVYFHGEIDPATREASNGNLSVGGLYAEVEDLPLGLNVRAGRIDIPFGEEYERRTVMDNPLVAHSLSDLWGFDEGVEVFGSSNAFSYVASLLDGDLNSVNRAHSSLSGTVRVGYDPNSTWGIGASAMRTGWLNGAQSELSALWFANGFFVALPKATSFDADLAEFDVHAAWGKSQLRAAVGVAAYQDNGPAANRRHFTYGYIEDVQPLIDSLSASLRWSAIAVPHGYPLVGQGASGPYLFGNILTTQLERLSFGFDYQFADPVLLKVDYSPEWGKTTNAGKRDNEQFFSTELGVKF
ncbi:MAG TPA: hypothetical protein VGL42_00295 [Opitutaceae bacterium]